jgi:hypothetical protein
MYNSIHRTSLAFAMLLLFTVLNEEEMRLASNGTNFIPNFVNIGHVVQMMKWGTRRHIIWLSYKPAVFP